MSEEAGRRTRGQKRALERETPAGDGKRLKLSEVKASLRLELQTGHTEMKRERRSPSPDDVIVLSDEAPSPRVNGGNHCRDLDTDLLMRSSADVRECVIKQLKEELRLEEAKLILLKKIRHSQEHKDSSGQKPVVSVSAALPVLVKGSTAAKAAQPLVSSRACGSVNPPPLVRSGQGSKPSAQVLMPPLVRAQVSSSGPPALLLGPRASLTSVQGHRIQPGLIRMASAPSASLLVLNQPSSGSSSRSLASRQAAARLALRKQLERALLDIPPPRPAAPQLSFMPSASSSEFIHMLGLEEVVQRLLEALGRGKQGPYAGLAVSGGEPSCCSQCQTDFTCRWRRDKGGAIMCEQCMSSNQKKALRAEHTNRLKAAFVKALQQEQEMEQHILQQATPPSSSSSSSSSALGPKADPLKRRPLPQPAPIKQVPRPAPLQLLQIRSGPRSSSSQLQNAVAAAALVSRPGVAMAYVNPSLERHREFLLDMIPSRSVSHTANSWK